MFMTKFFRLLLLIIFPLIIISSCEKDDDSPRPQDSIVGTWYGIRSYINPVSGIQYQYLTISFDSNGIGILEYEGPITYSLATFTYSIQNDTIICHGSDMDADGYWSEDFNMTLKIEGDRLIPTDRFSMFILTRDGSVETDGNGEEIIDDSQLIYGVWLHNSGKVVLVFDYSNFTEYSLLSDPRNVYYKKTEGSFSYNYRQKYVNIGDVYYNVVNLTNNSLQLKLEGSNKTYNYTRGTEADIPSNGEGMVDYKVLLELPRFWGDDKDIRTIVFNNSNQVTYYETSSKPYGSWGHISLIASGTYWVVDKEINCVFDDVYWEGGTSGSKNYFPDWTCGEKNFKIFTIENINTESLKLKFDDGNSYYFCPFYL